MGPSLPRSLDHPGRGGLQTGTIHGWWHRLALCFCLPEQYKSPCTLIRHRTPWHHDWWHTECQHMLPSTPTPDMETTTTQGTYSVPQRTKWRARCSPFLLPQISTMGYCHCKWINWGAAYHRSDLRRHRVQIHASHIPFSSELSSSFPWWHTGVEHCLMRSWEMCPLPKWRNHLAWRRWTHLHVYLWPPPPGIPGQCHPEGLCHCTGQPFTIPDHHVQIPWSS